MRNKIILLFVIVSLFQYSGVNAQRITLPNGQTPFFSGMNVAWRNFGGDIADTPANLNDWKKVLDEVKAAGGNTIRWWLFVNCSQVPKFDANGYVSGLGSQSVNNIKAVLDLAQERNMVIILCLFSFDMLQTAEWGVNEANNKKMLQTDAGITASINKAVVPLVTGVGNHPSILCWEIFNEPEGMTTFGWTPSKVGMYDIQRYVNRAAGAIHRAVPGVKVSNGSWNMKVLCNKIGYKNYYSDAELKTAGGDADGYLDFYMVHYYNNDGGDNTQHSPFHHPSSYWGLDKPILVAEYAAKGVDNPYLTPKDCYQKVYDGNYAGALSWTYTAHDGLGGLPEATPGIKYLYDNHKADVTITFLKLTAEAGLNQLVYDANNDGAELVTLDGSGSKSTSGTISYVWKENGQTIATSAKPAISLSVGVHTISLTVTDNVNPSLTDNVIITVKTPSLSYKKPVQATSTEVGVNIATNVVDGDTATRWASLPADPQSITVDLQAIYKLSSINLLWEFASAKDYTIQVSLDGITYVTPAMVTKTGMAAGARLDNITGLSNLARFVRVTGSARTSTYGYSLFEFEVWGKAQGVNRNPVAAFTSLSNSTSTAVQIDVKSLLNARPVITYTNGKIVPMSGGIDAGSYSAEATLEAAVQLKNANPIAMPNDGKYAANARHPEVILNFSNADGTSPQVRRTTVNETFNFVVPEVHYTKMQIFAMSSGMSPITVTLNYSDGSTDVKNLQVIDWYNYPGAPAETTDRFNLDVNLDKWDQNNARSEQYNHYLYGFDLAPNSNKTLKSVTIAVISGGCFTFWGATGVSLDMSPSSVTFDGSTSTDPDLDVLTYAWDFGDGTTGTGKVATHTYAKGGFYSVKLTVNDGDGGINEIVKIVTVYPLQKYNIQANANPGGTISPSGTVSVTETQSQTFTITPAKNYTIASVIVDGISIGNPNTYTFTNVNEPHTISVSYTPGANANLAIGKPVVVSTTEAGFGNITTNVNDENLNTRWSSEYTDPQTIYIDLLENYNVTSIVLNWEIANAKSYTIEFSNDAITWTNPISKAAMATGLRVDVIPVNSVNARYVRVTGLTRNTLFGYSLYEFEIYGTKALVTQTIQLQKGWNLLSTNLVVSNNQIQTLFAGLDVEMVKNSNGFWKKGQIQALNSLQTVSPGEGYLVKMNTSGNLVISGTPLSIANSPLTIKNGWNIIGCQYQTSTPITSVFNGTNSQIIKNFDGFWEPNGLMNSISNLEPGKAYFLKK